MKQIIDTVGIDNAVLISITIVSFILGLISSKITHSFDLKLQAKNIQLNNIYLPIFKMLEPYLYNYQKLDIKTVKSIINKCNKIFDENYQYVFSTTLNTYNIWKNNLNSSNDFDYFCEDIDTCYEKTKRFLKLPSRNLDYKINNRQYRNKFRLIMSGLWFIFINILLWLFTSILLIFVFVIITLVI